MREELLLACTGCRNMLAARSATDAMKLSDVHRKKLCELMHFAFLEIRLLGWAGKAEQAAELADAFHNLPKGMWSEDFSLEFFRDAFLAAYQKKYSEGRVRDYVEVLNQILAEGENPAAN